MARPRIFDYSAESDEQIVTSGVQGAKLTWFGMDIDRQIIHIVCDEGTLTVTGDGIEVVTRQGHQVTLEGNEVANFYTNNKSSIDTIISAAWQAWADEQGKTGAVITT